MGDPTKMEMRLAASYLWVIAPLKAVCDEHGYALGLHGSMLRDLDVICAPWKEQVSPPHVLAQAVMDRFGGYIAEQNEGTVPRIKPHGRLGWPIHLCPGYYIDLSIMPVGRQAVDPQHVDSERGQLRLDLV